MMRWLGPLALALLVIGGAIAYARYGDRTGERSEPGRASPDAYDAVLRALAENEAMVKRLRARFEEIDDLKTAQESALRRYRNADHLRAARTLGLDRVTGDQDLEQLERSGHLVRLKDNQYYYIQDLTVSVPYVTPDMARALEQIGRRMQEALDEEGLPPYRFNISSVLRTGADQKALRRINPNAARGVSAHEYGTTLDVVYHTYDHPVSDSVASSSASAERSLDALLNRMTERSLDALGMIYWQELQGVLGRVLIELQSEGTILVTLERQQPVFHITVARRIADEK